MIIKFSKYLLLEYSRHESDIKDFIEKLPEKVILYRSLFLQPGEEINLNKLGSSWTLDYNFAEYAYEYKSFTPKMSDIMKIIHIEVPKKFIDIKKTIDRRIIDENEKYFWDELTDEWIENDDLEMHSYEHEDEIVLKNVPELQNYITEIETKEDIWDKYLR